MGAAGRWGKNGPRATPPLAGYALQSTLPSPASADCGEIVKGRGWYPSPRAWRGKAPALLLQNPPPGEPLQAALLPLGREGPLGDLPQSAPRARLTRRRKRRRRDPSLPAPPLPRGARSPRPPGPQSHHGPPHSAPPRGGGRLRGFPGAWPARRERAV